MTATDDGGTAPAPDAPGPSERGAAPAGDVSPSPDAATPGDGAARRPGVAAFDFDGTLAERDTFVPFLRAQRGLPRLLAATALSAVRAHERDALKVAVVGRLFRGMSADALDAAGRDYASTLPPLLRPTMVERVRWHQDQGHAVVIVSASLGTYLRPLAEHLGLDAALGVELVTGADGVLTGAVVGELNTRGPQKVARLQTWAATRFGPASPFELWAYGDSAGDEEMLALADHPTWVGRRAVTSD